MERENRRKRGLPNRSNDEQPWPKSAHTNQQTLDSASRSPRSVVCCCSYTNSTHNCRNSSSNRPQEENGLVGQLVDQLISKTKEQFCNELIRKLGWQNRADILSMLRNQSEERDRSSLAHIEGATSSTGDHIEVALHRVMQMPATNEGFCQSSSDVQANSPSDVQANSPSDVQANSPSDVQANSPSDVQANSPSDMQANSPSDVQANSPVMPQSLAVVSPVSSLSESSTDSSPVSPQSRSPLYSAAEAPVSPQSRSVVCPAGSEDRQTDGTTHPEPHSISAGNDLLQLELSVSSLVLGPVDLSRWPLPVVKLTSDGLEIKLYLRADSGSGGEHNATYLQISSPEILQCALSGRQHLFLFVTPSCEEKIKLVLMRTDVPLRGFTWKSFGMLMFRIRCFTQRDLSTFYHIMWNINKRSMFGHVFIEINETDAKVLLDKVKTAVMVPCHRKNTSTVRSACNSTTPNPEDLQQPASISQNSCEAETNTQTYASDEEDSAATCDQDDGYLCDSSQPENHHGNHSPAEQEMTNQDENRTSEYHVDNNEQNNMRTPVGASYDNVRTPGGASYDNVRTPGGASYDSEGCESDDDGQIGLECNDIDTASMVSAQFDSQLSCSQVTHEDYDERGTDDEDRNETFPSLLTVPTQPDNVLSDDEASISSNEGSRLFQSSKVESNESDGSSDSDNNGDDDDDEDDCIIMEDLTCSFDNETVATAAVTSNASSSGDGELMMTNAVVSIRCPITQQIMSEPVRNFYCHHVYEKQGVLQLIRNRKGTAKCPVRGCENEEPLDDNDLYADEGLKNSIAEKIK